VEHAVSSLFHSIKRNRVCQEKNFGLTKGVLFDTIKVEEVMQEAWWYEIYCPTCGVLKRAQSVKNCPECGNEQVICLSPEPPKGEVQEDDLCI
jgi:rRNA maturation endonuclease Nob1